MRFVIVDSLRKRYIRAHIQSIEAIFSEFPFLRPCPTPLQYFLPYDAINGLQGLRRRRSNYVSYRRKCLQHTKTTSPHQSLLLQPTNKHNYSATVIQAGDTVLKAVDRFYYLGSLLISAANIDEDVSARLAKASAAFGRFTKRL